MKRLISDFYTLWRLHGGMGFLPDSVVWGCLGVVILLGGLVLAGLGYGAWELFKWLVHLAQAQ